MNSKMNSKMNRLIELYSDELWDLCISENISSYGEPSSYHKLLELLRSAMSDSFKVGELYESE
jgi:hypothetical protein